MKAFKFHSQHLINTSNEHKRITHTQEKSVSATSFFKSELGNATDIQIFQGEKLKEHITKTPALLICIKGEAIFENENSIRETLKPGDYVNIEPIKWVKWKKGLYKMACVRWLKKKYRENLTLFPHWALVHP